MWTIDFYSDYKWIKEKWPLEAVLSLPMKFSTFPGKVFTLLVYGDESGIKHIRINTELESKEEVETFTSTKIMMIKNSFELLTGMLAGDKINLSPLSHGDRFLISYGEGDVVPLHIEATMGQQAPFDYDKFSTLFKSQFPGFEPYCFYLNMASNSQLPVDYRWLNYYRILETRFNQTGDGLDKNSEYKNFVKQQGVITTGKNAEIRGAIHAFARGATPGIGQYNSKYSGEMETTLPAMERLAYEALNAHPDNQYLRFSPRATPSPSSPSTNES